MSDKSAATADSKDSASAKSEAKPAKAEKPPTAEKPPKEKKPEKVKAAKEKSQKKGGFPVVFALVPVALIAAAVLAFMLPPTHAMLMKSPLRPLLARFDHSSAKPAAVAKSADSPTDVKRLNDTLESDRKAALEKDAQIAQLQSQLKGQAAAPPAAATAPAAKATPAAAVPTDEMKRAAAYWAGMDPDKVAEVIKQLPDSYVKTVFSAMSPDAVADIMSELPAKTAARLTTNAGADSP